MEMTSYENHVIFDAPESGTSHFFIKLHERLSYHTHDDYTFRVLHPGSNSFNSCSAPRDILCMVTNKPESTKSKSIPSVIQVVTWLFLFMITSVSISHDYTFKFWNRLYQVLNQNKTNEIFIVLKYCIFKECERIQLVYLKCVHSTRCLITRWSLKN